MRVLSSHIIKPSAAPLCSQACTLGPCTFSGGVILGFGINVKAYTENMRSPHAQSKSPQPPTMQRPTHNCKRPTTPKCKAQRKKKAKPTPKCYKADAKMQGAITHRWGCGLSRSQRPLRGATRSPARLSGSKLLENDFQCFVFY